MARLSDQLIGRLKQEVSLVALVQAKGFTLKPHGKDYAMCCPFHRDDTASLIITPDKNLWHCMGACQTGGTVIDWVMKSEGVSFRHAVELLRNEFLPLAAENSDEPTIVKHNTTPKLPPPLAANADQQTALRQVIDYYHEVLKQSPEALEYLESRGLKSAEMIDQFKLGYANRTLAYRLPQKNRKEGAELRGLLQEIGLLRESGHEHFNGSLVVPVFDENGLITEVYGRKLLGNRLRPGTPVHTYLPGPHQGVWNSEALHASKDIILCESLIDAMTFWCHGFRHVTTSYGVAGFTEDHLTAFKKHGIERVYIAYDRDEAGNVAAEKLAKKLVSEGMECFRVLFPKGMDANEYARQVQPAAKSLELVIRKAEWMGGGSAKATVVEAESVPAHEASEIAALAAKEKNDAPVEKIESLPLTEKAEKPAEIPYLVAASELVSDDIKTEIGDNEITLTLGERRYRVRGLQKNMSHEQLKLNLLVSGGEGFHVDTFDIYSARHRAAFIKQAASELSVHEDVLKRELGKVLLKLEMLQDQQIQDTLTPKEKTPAMSSEELHAALALLKDPQLLERILEDFTRAGVVGEETNKLVAYLAACSRKLEKPLAVMVQSSSAAGKSSLMEAVLAFMPEEERIQYSAMTGQALFYMGEKDLKHKILAIAEEEGATHASYALKLLQSEGQVSIASTGKNATTGNLETQEYKVEGPVMLFSTTTAIDLDEELLNRCITLSVDESREQTRAIHAAQRARRTLEGQRARKDKMALTTLHQNAQRLLRPLGVINPYADHLTFLDDKTRTRRDHEKYLGLIDAIALLHQYQREIIQDHYEGETCEYVVVTLEDIAVANRLAHEVLGRTLDELPPQTRKLLNIVHRMVTDGRKNECFEHSAYRFTRKQVRDYSGWGNTQLKVHLDRLEDMEYVISHGGGRGKVVEYELLYQGEGQAGDGFLMGLIDVETMQSYDAKKTGVNDELSGPKRPQIGPKTGLNRGAENQKNAENKAENANSAESPEKCTTGPKKINGASYRSDEFPPLAAKAAATTVMEG